VGQNPLRIHESATRYEPTSEYESPVPPTALEAQAPLAGVRAVWDIDVRRLSLGSDNEPDEDLAFDYFAASLRASAVAFQKVRATKYSQEVPS
jgi:hypothetical protein